MARAGLLILLDFGTHHSTQEICEQKQVVWGAVPEWGNGGWEGELGDLRLKMALQVKAQHKVYAASPGGMTEEEF